MTWRAWVIIPLVVLLSLMAAGYALRHRDDSQTADQRDLCHLAKSNSQAIRVIAESQLTVFNTVLAGNLRSIQLRQQLTAVVQDLGLQIDTLKTREQQPCP